MARDAAPGMEDFTMKVLAGDVGGTNTRLAICEVKEDQLIRLAEDVQPSGRFKTFKEIVRAFAVDHQAEVRAVCFGLPGPVRGRRAQLTNLPWAVDADELERELGLPSVSIINDLVANAYGLATLDQDDFQVVREGVADPNGNAGLISAGTGLGEAGMHRIGGVFHPFATEGGHTDFAPANDLEIDLLRFLQARYEGHVSWERVVSGPAIAVLYEFLLERDPSRQPGWLRDELAEASDPTSVIAKAASQGRCDLAREALDLFLALYGAEAGNFALKVFATGGIYLGGGIAPKLAGLFAESPFLARFDDKGRLRRLVEQMPVRIVLNDKAALQGAAVFAARHLDARAG